MPETIASLAAFYKVQSYALQALMQMDDVAQDEPLSFEDESHIRDVMENTDEEGIYTPAA